MIFGISVLKLAYISCKNLDCYNAKTFKAVSKEVREIINLEKIRSRMTNQGISWEVINPKSPWKRGTWERLVRSVKRSLHKVVGRSVLNSEELRTVLVEIE